MSLSKADQEFVAICQQQGVEIEPADMADIYGLYFYAQQHRKERLYRPTVEASNKKILPFVALAAGAALGAFVLAPAIAGIGALQGALLAGGLGYQLGSLFNRKKRQTDSNENPLFEFSGTGELIVLGEPVPKVYANKTLNPDGGIVFTRPPTVWSRVFSARGAQFLQRISVLSSGKLGAIDEDSLTLNQQSRSLFGVGDVETEVNLSNDHNPAPGIPYRYSQAVRVSTNTFLGIDSELGTSVPASSIAPVFANPVNVTNTPSTTNILKSGGIDGTFDGSVEVQELTLPSEVNSFIGVTFAVTGLQALEVGIAATVPTLDASILFSDAGTYEIKISGGVVSSGGYAALDTFSVRYYRGIPSNGVVFLLGSESLHAADLVIADDATPYFSFATNSEGANEVSVSEYSATVGASQILSGYGRRFLAGDDAIEDIDIELIYRSGSSEFRIVSKATDYIETDTSIFIGASSVAGIYRARYTTSQNVTAVELTIRFSLFARDKDGDLIFHGQAWDLFIQRDDEAAKLLESFFVASRREKGTRRSLIIKNLPMGKYTFTLEPLTRADVVTDIPRLRDGTALTEVDSGQTYDGQAVLLDYSTNGAESASQIRELLSQTENAKIQTSNEQGATGTLSHVNEFTDPADIGYPSPIKFKGFSQVYTSVLASDRLQNAPEEGHAIDEGAVIRQYLSSGVASSSSTATQLDDVGACFSGDGVAVGDQVRILPQSKNRVITGVFDLSLTLTEYQNQSANLVAGSALITVDSGVFSNAKEGMPIEGDGIQDGSYIIQKIGTDTLCIGDEWGREKTATSTGAEPLTLNSGSIPPTGGEYVVFSIGSSPYFPDIYVDRLINPADGLGAYISQDHFIDFTSICYARRFCEQNELFYEAIVTGGSFEQWATEAAPSSLLFATKLDGKFALIPEQEEPVSGIYNAGNVIEYSEPYVPWIEQNINTILAKYADREGRDRQMKVMTIEAQESGVEILKTIELRGVKSDAQARRISVYSLNSIRKQDRVCTFSSDIATLNLRQGDLVRTQHVITEYDTQTSGKILVAGELQDPRVEATETITSIQSLAPGSGNTTIVRTTQPHELVDGDSVVISGSNIDGTYVPKIFDNMRFSVPASYVEDGGGSIARSRIVYDQSVVLSGVATLPSNYRISVGNQSKAQVDLVIEDNGNGLVVKGLERASVVGEVYCLGLDSPLDRTWRISSIKPDITANKVEVSCVLWVADLGSEAGLAILEPP